MSFKVPWGHFVLSTYLLEALKENYVQQKFRSCGLRINRKFGMENPPKQQRRHSWSVNSLSRDSTESSDIVQSECVADDEVLNNANKNTGKIVC